MWTHLSENEFASRICWAVKQNPHLSKLPLARNLPQGENATLYTGSLCLRKTDQDQSAIYLLAQTLSKCGRRCPFQRPTAAQWSQSWQRRAPEDRVVSIRSGTTEIILKLWWSKKKSSPCSYQVHVWILSARACGAPFYGVDLLLVSLERVNGCNLIV